MPYQPTWNERVEDAKRYVGPAIALAIVLGTGGWLGWRYFQSPREPAVASRASVRPESRTPAERARAAVERSLALEQEAAQAQQRGQWAEAIEKGQEALRAHREASALVPGDPRYAVREAKLVAAVEQLEAEPLRSAVAVGQALGTAASTRESWAEALKALQEARAAQAALNERYPKSGYASVAALDRLEAEIATVRAAVVAAKISAAEREGDAAATARRTPEAAAAYARAEGWQRELNQNFPRTRLASTERLAALGRKREAALAHDAIEALRGLEQQIDLLLRHRQPSAAAEKIKEAAALLAQTAPKLPQATTTVDAMRRAKVEFLASLHGELGALQQDADARLVALGGLRSLRMLRTEVPQDFFARVMGKNPSRRAGGALPVDSVTWHDAQEFCRRLSWILGQVVRLPSEIEFRAAAAGPAGRDAPWSEGNSGGQTREVGLGVVSSAGVADLLGNVAEWLQPTSPEAPQAPVAGGSYLDTAADVAGLPVTLADKRERARHIGFRVVAEPGN